MTYRLRVTARAVTDADEAYAWIAEHHSPAQAERWYQGLIKQMETLTRQPSRCPPGTGAVATRLRMDAPPKRGSMAFQLLQLDRWLNAKSPTPNSLSEPQGPCTLDHVGSRRPDDIMTAARPARRDGFRSWTDLDGNGV